MGKGAYIVAKAIGISLPDVMIGDTIPFTKHGPKEGIEFHSNSLEVKVKGRYVYNVEVQIVDRSEVTIAVNKKPIDRFHASGSGNGILELDKHDVVTLINSGTSVMRFLSSSRNAQNLVQLTLNRIR